MGFPTALESRFRSAVPATPPEVLTPDSASFPLRPSEEKPWNARAPPSPPMSNYEPSVKASDVSLSGKGSEEISSQRDPSPEQSAPRQQLPSLSSLFGPVSQLSPLPSPYPERPGHHYSASSPLDHPLRPTVGSSSYFPTPASQPRSLAESRPQDRPQIPSLSHVFPGPLSPALRQDQRHDGRSEYSSSSQWSAQHESSREYSLGSRDHHHQYYQPSHDRYQPHQPTGRDDSGRLDFRDQATHQTPAHNPPAAPTSNGGLETSPVKDGLGPKIWTGTQFLPRFVRAAEVPGEGMCYFYDDGSHCKTVIDGEAVNAHWGVTKAGKPRKRLAIACMTCREKKIKCDPDYPRCVQCEKFGRVCKFKNAPRGGHNTSPSTPSAEPEDLRRLGGPLPRPPPVEPHHQHHHHHHHSHSSHHTRPSSHSSGSVSPRTTHRPPSPDPASSGPRKLARIGYEHYSPTAGRRSPLAQTPEFPRPGSGYSWRQPETLPRIHDDVMRRTWQSD
ncbi:hypothetical protein B0J18DRAFT_358847, partial [Chaetomium sp. MPI-SDFR-AT-0129]